MSLHSARNPRPPRLDDLSAGQLRRLLDEELLRYEDGHNYDEYDYWGEIAPWDERELGDYFPDPLSCHYPLRPGPLVDQLLWDPLAQLLRR